MGLFTTRQLLGYTEQKVKFRALFLELFFVVRSLSILRK